MTPHPLTNVEVQAYYENEPRFIGVYSRDNLPDKIKVVKNNVAKKTEYNKLVTKVDDIDATNFV